MGSWPRSPAGYPLLRAVHGAGLTATSSPQALTRLTSHIPVLLAIYTPSMEIIPPLSTLRNRCGARVSPIPANHRALIRNCRSGASPRFVTVNGREIAQEAVPGCSLAGTVIRRDTNYRAPMAGIVPDNPLHFLHPWRSDGLVASHLPVLLATYTPSMEISVSREGIPGAARETCPEKRRALTWLIENVVNILG